MSTFVFIIAGPLYTVWYRYLDLKIEPLITRFIQRRVALSTKTPISFSTTTGTDSSAKAKLIWNVTLAKGTL